jgi:hypothetical protein
MHYAALGAMELNAQLAHARLPEAQLLNPNSLSVILPSPPSIVLVKALDWWNSSTGDGRISHEESWRITSDSLAAWLAVQQDAAELVLLKSAEPPYAKNEQERANVWAAQGYVDPAFPEWLSGKLCHAVNLRASTWNAH